MKHPAKLRLRLRGAAALLALLALAAGAVFALRGRAQAAEWTFEPEPGQVFAAFGNSFAACSSTQLQIYGPEGELCLRAELPQPAPALAASDTRLAVWSAGGESFSVFDAQGELGSVEAEGELLDLRLRGDMAVAAVMGGEGLGLVTVYDGLLRPVYRWHAQTAWPLAAELSPEGDALAVLAASEAGGVCTNGMSNSRRDGENANAAVLVTLRPEDFPDKSTLGGMYWQRSIEQRAFARGGGNYHAPAQLAGDFLAGRASTGPGRVQPTYRPGVTWCDLHDMLPARITDTLAQALPAFGRKLRGFDDPDAVLTAPETRSSSPVRIVRGEDRCSTGVPGLYPCGEGAGYAGGITSAAVDGLRCAESVLAALQNEA